MKPKNQVEVKPGKNDKGVKNENGESTLTNGNASDSDALNTNNNSLPVKVASVESYKKENTLGKY